MRVGANFWSGVIFQKCANLLNALPGNSHAPKPAAHWLWIPPLIALEFLTIGATIGLIQSPKRCRFIHQFNIETISNHETRTDERNSIRLPFTLRTWLVFNKRRDATLRTYQQRKSWKASNAIQFATSLRLLARRTRTICFHLILCNHLTQTASAINSATWCKKELRQSLTPISLALSVPFNI